MPATHTLNTSTAYGMGRVRGVVLWVLQIAAAAMIGMAGFAKLTADPAMVGLFDTIGIGQWFRYLTGALEVGGAALLLSPRLSGVGALVVAPVMLGAVLTHLFIIGGSPAVPLLLLAAALIVAYGRRERALNFGGR